MEDRFKKFVALVEAGTYTAASKQLHTSQPALTTAIQKLESELRTPLLVRGGRSLQLTPAGHIAYEHGVQLIIMEGNLQSQLLELADKKQSLNLGSIDSVAALLVQKELLTVLERESELLLSVQDSQSLLRAVHSGAMDIALVVAQEQWGNSTKQRLLGSEQFSFVCSEEQEDYFTEAIKQGTVPDFLAYGQPSTTRTIIDSQLGANGLIPEIRFSSTNPSLLLDMALQGKGAAILPRAMVTPHLVENLTELTLKKPVQRPIYAVWQATTKLPASIQEFLDVVHMHLT